MAKKQKSKNNNKPYTYAIGRRKSATARVRLYDKKKVPGTDHQFIVNQKEVSKYFPGEVNEIKYRKPFNLTDTGGQFSISAKVEGSGKSSQLDAVVHGISRALSSYDRDKYRTTLKKAGMLTRDPRAKERRKPGTGGKARRKRQSPKR